ncbi:helix-turn-helix transcriptional regulator [Kitasatospora sp. NPDC086801]|uniref:helix-turn-helix domain-containing protein n=1 Tax=Kitasatospora sp. NPDC086801 TaxID=3364066 RepID=UPI00380E45A0
MSLDYVIDFSPREREVLHQIASGCTYEQTARRLGISVHTVNTYLRRIRAKAPAGTHADLVRLSLRVNGPAGSGRLSKAVA